jgi:hypothetical protein
MMDALGPARGFMTLWRGVACGGGGGRSGYPLQEIPVSVYWYYMFELGLYIHLGLYQFVDTKRSDFWEMFVHHLATLGLIVFSWLSW